MLITAFGWQNNPDITSSVCSERALTPQLRMTLMGEKSSSGFRVSERRTAFTKMLMQKLANSLCYDLQQLQQTITGETNVKHAKQEARGGPPNARGYESILLLHSFPPSLLLIVQRPLLRPGRRPDGTSASVAQADEPQSARDVNTEARIGPRVIGGREAEGPGPLLTLAPLRTRGRRGRGRERERIV